MATLQFAGEYEILCAELCGVEAAVQGGAFADAGRAEDADGGDRVVVHVRFGSKSALSGLHSVPNDRIRWYWPAAWLDVKVRDLEE